MGKTYYIQKMFLCLGALKFCRISKKVTVTLLLMKDELRSGGGTGAKARKLPKVTVTSAFSTTFEYSPLFSSLATLPAFEYPCVWEWLSPGGLPGLQHR